MQSLNKEVLRLSIPSILANITIPLVGMVDVAIVGHVANATAIGGVAIGTMLFDLLYWNFGFLRIGTSGLTAQAFGRRDMRESVGIFAQTSAIALASALLIWAVQWLFLLLVMSFVPCSPEVAVFARQYFFIRIWAAPATLMLMVFKGWFIGMQNTVAPMICDIVVNVVNMVASYVLAVGTPLGMMGVAYGTLIAQYVGLLVAIVLMWAKYGRLLGEFLPQIALFKGIRKVFRLSGDLFVRSLCFMVIYVGFTSLASKYGDDQLAVSAIMMKLFMLFSYFVDGFAYAGEALTGRFIGEKDGGQLNHAVQILFLWTLGVGLIFTVVYAAAGEWSVRLMTSDESVIVAARPFLPWLVAMPLVSCLAFMWDGIFIGATAGKSVRNCMIWAAVAFVAGYLCCFGWCGVQALYIGYFAHLLARVVYLSAAWKKTRELYWK
ncbi:MAG: MATE family efflux transporter [Bacteroidales bacterium]|nr:MATE family efflux transporter [Bacteroidales bacterium]